MNNALGVHAPNPRVLTHCNIYTCNFAWDFSVFDLLELETSGFTEKFFYNLIINA